MTVIEALNITNCYIDVTLTWHFVSFFLKVGSVACPEFITHCNGTPLVSPELFPLWKRHKNSGNLQRNAIIWPIKLRQRNSVGH